MTFLEILAGWTRGRRIALRGMVRPESRAPMNDTSTSTRSDAVPEGWPPTTPVEVLRVGRTLARVLIAALLLNAITLLGLAAAVCYHGSEENTLLRGILETLQTR